MHNGLINLEILIVTANRLELLQALIASIPAALSVQITFIINGSDQKTYQYLSTHLDSRYRVLQLEHPVTPASARNKALAGSRAEWVLFLDDDVILSENYFNQAFEFIASHREADCFGGHDWAYPGCSPWEFSLNLTLTSPLATAHTRARHRPGEGPAYLTHEAELTLCNLWIKRDFLVRHKLSFPDHYFRNEENVLLLQMSRLEAKIWRTPTLFVYHKRRASFLAAMKSVFSSGRYRMKSILEDQTLGSPLYLAPLIALVIFGCVLILWPVLALVLFGLYGLITACTSGVIASRHQVPQLFFAIWLNHWGLNLAYALGSARGLWGPKAPES